MSTEFELFNGTNFSDLMRDIYHNSKKKSRQIDGLIKELQPLIKNTGDASVLVPMIKDYLEVSVKNDEHLVKLAGVLQRILNKSKGESDESSLLSESEKEELPEMEEQSSPKSDSEICALNLVFLQLIMKKKYDTLTE